MELGAALAHEHSARRRALAAALALVAVVAVADVLVGGRAVLIPLLVVGPLVAAMRATPDQVSAVAVVTLLTAVALGAVDGLLDTDDGAIAILAVAAGSVVGIVAARGRQQLTGTVRQQGMLARAGDLLDAPLDTEAMLRQITSLAVPEHADLAIVDLRRPDGTLRGSVTCAADPELASALDALRERFPLDPDGAHPVAEVLRTGEPQILPDMGEEKLRSIARSPEHAELMLRARYRAAIVVPLAARGRTFGVLSFLRMRDSRPFGDEDLAVSRDLARRASLALDNARLFSELSTSEARMEAIVANLGEAVSAFAPDGTFLFANQAAADFAGVASPEELVAGGLGDLADRWTTLDETGREVAVADLPLLRALAGEEPEPVLLHNIERATGRDLWRMARVVPVRDGDGTLQMLVQVSEDITAVKRQEQRERLLSTASKLLGSSLDIDATLDKAAWAVVPELADWARVDLPDERGVLRQAAVAHRDLAKVEVLNAWRRDFPPEPADARGPWEVLRTGRPVVWDRIDPGDVERYAQSPGHADVMRSIGTQSMLIVPMIVGDRVIGTMQLATTAESGRLLGRTDLELAEELARRAAIAVENARVHAERTHIAATLQRSLLPPRLPVIPGLTIAARFRAAGTATDVGGDFYDLFHARDRWMVMMGDVTGKGPAAAAVTSLARYTMRTVAMYEDDPRAMLRRLNATLGAEGDRRQICTAVCVAIDETGAGGLRAEIVCAGHPAPYLVTAAGDVTPVGAPGTLLGAFPEGRWHSTQVELAEGDALVLYTDGVTDVRGTGGRFGADGLEAVLRELGAAPADVTAARVDEALQAFGEQRDDVALMVLCASASDGDEASVVAVGDAA